MHNLTPIIEWPLTEILPSDPMLVGQLEHIASDFSGTISVRTDNENNCVTYVIKNNLLVSITYSTEEQNDK